MMTRIQRYLTSEMSDQELKAVFDILWQTWTWKNPYEVAYLNFKSKALENARIGSDRLRFVVWEGNQVIAHAGIFAREVHTEHRSIRLGALTAVCTHSDYRIQGFGAKVVRAALKLVDNGTFPVSLWMTTVPEFYKKLGARIVENTWSNSQNTENPTADPWPDEQKMIYPANYAWPTGRIDLNGPAY